MAPISARHFADCYWIRPIVDPDPVHHKCQGVNVKGEPCAREGGGRWFYRHRLSVGKIYCLYHTDQALERERSAAIVQSRVLLADARAGLYDDITRAARYVHVQEMKKP